MEILQVISSFYPAYAYGGALKTAYDLSKHLVELGHNVTVYTTDVFDSESRYKCKNPVLIEGIEIYYFKNFSNKLAYNNLPFAPSMAIHLRKNIKKFDVVHIHEYRSFQAILAHHYAKKYNIPYILQAHGSMPRLLEKTNLKEIYDFIWGFGIIKDASKIVTVSNIESKQYNEINIDSKKLVKIPNIIDIDRFRELPVSGTFRSKHNIYNKHVILYVGRIHKTKGLKFLLKAFKSLMKDINDCILVLVGPDGGERQKLEEMASLLKINSNILFLPQTENPEEAYVDADIVVYPSEYEIFGLVPFEALLCKKPVIVTKNCGCAEIITNFSDYIVDYGNIDEFKEMMETILVNKDIGQEMVDIGNSFIENNLNLKVLIKNFEDLYESVKK
jgi:glycosyltransferase involved in cell wall biosynthesis